MARFCNHCHHTTIWKRIVESRFYRTVRRRWGINCHGELLPREEGPYHRGLWWPSRLLGLASPALIRGLRATSDGDGQRGPPTSAQTHPWQAHLVQGEEHPSMVGALTTWAGVIVTVLMVLWNKLDKRFDDLEARQEKQFDQLKTDGQMSGLGGRGSLSSRTRQILPQWVPGPTDEDHVLNRTRKGLSPTPPRGASHPPSVLYAPCPPGLEAPRPLPLPGHHPWWPQPGS